MACPAAGLSAVMVEVRFRSGTIEVEGLTPDFAGLPATWDERSACHRAPAQSYPDVLRALTRLQVKYEDRARRYEVLAEGARAHHEPRPYQREALVAWREAGARG